MYWVNGIKNNMLSVDNRSFLYGDGCFTTILTIDGAVQCWPLHINRMEACLNKLCIPIPQWQQVKQWLEMAALTDKQAGLKLHISRGSGGRGYSPKKMAEPTITITAFNEPEHYTQLRTDGITLGICHERLGINPMLAGHKHNNRLEQILLKAEMDHLGLQDGVVLDINDDVIETTMANLFWRQQTTLYTPSLKNSGVAGIMRQRVIEQVQSVDNLSYSDLTLEIGTFKLNHLLDAEEIFITNAILGVVPVIAIAQQHYSIGQVSRYFQRILNR